MCVDAQEEYMMNKENHRAIDSIHLCACQACHRDKHSEPEELGRPLFLESCSDKRNQPDCLHGLPIVARAIHHLVAAVMV